LQPGQVRREGGGPRPLRAIRQPVS
jgi:hypothetical protein